MGRPPDHVSLGHDCEYDHPINSRVLVGLCDQSSTEIGYSGNLLTDTDKYKTTKMKFFFFAFRLDSKALNAWKSTSQWDMPIN
jgi:hypothetical protein